MKYVLFVLSTVLLVGLFSFSPAQPELLPTKLRITVIDGLGNPAEGATVTIYLNEDDYRNSENPVAKAISDNKGRVTFKDLKPVPYFIDARKGDMNNDFEGVRTAALEEGKLNKVNTVIE
ncbi:carboxypeptidase-like regulatory domain-containing protein [Marinoscillum sp. 108]|uniref:Carboxypeptidase-like regulatory domain-containing protein n=1 Tax=Marinoscillum luteum TaxID=861051 RepID=A0ABW7NEG2_9BACT|nr:carboxypeptidase regulatory-like domain-containing protein [Marinoscillum sp. 108]